LKDTEAEIQNRIGITYETFTNSAFFAQGKADLFIKNGPTNRRKVLSEILGLSRYETLSKKAKDKADEVKGKIESTRARIEVLKSDIAPLPSLRAHLHKPRSNKLNRLYSLFKPSCARSNKKNKTLLS